MDTQQKLKSLWKKLGINGQVINFSSKTLWVLETNTGKSIAHLLLPMTKSPIKIDADAFRREDGKAIEGHASWWKFYDFSTVEVYDKGNDVRLSVITKVKVSDEEFGGKSIVYDSSKSWGVPIKLVTDIRRNKKGKITKYLVSEIGWVSPEEALSLTCQRGIDNARPVFPSGGNPYIRTRRDRELFNNLEGRG
jgi:hypothetical protein